MGTTFGKQIRTIADIFQTALKCSKAEADALEQKCTDPTSIAKLATACGISKMGVGFGGVLMVGGATLPEGIVLTAAGIAGVKRFCMSVVNRAGGALNNEQLSVP